MSQRGRRVGVVVVAAVVALGVAGPARAHWAASGNTRSDAVCSFTFPISASPGLSLTPGSGSFTSGRETGRADCVGHLLGQEVTGPGRFGVQGRYGSGLAGLGGDSCAGGGGHGTYSMTVPVRGDKVVRASGPFTFKYVGTGTGTVEARLGAARFDGTLQFVPTSGDCYLQPVTAATGAVQGAFREPGGPRLRAGSNWP